MTPHRTLETGQRVWRVPNFRTKERSELESRSGVIGGREARYPKLCLLTVTLTAREKIQFILPPRNTAVQVRNLQTLFSDLGHEADFTFTCSLDTLPFTWESAGIVLTVQEYHPHPQENVDPLLALFDD